MFFSPTIAVDNLSLFHRLEEVTAQANKFSRLIEQREEQVRSLKTRLEEAVHQNNKLTNAAELKDDRIKTLEQRWSFQYYPYYNPGQYLWNCEGFLS